MDKLKEEREKEIRKLLKKSTWTLKEKSLEKVMAGYSMAEAQPMIMGKLGNTAVEAIIDLIRTQRREAKEEVVEEIEKQVDDFVDLQEKKEGITQEDALNLRMGIEVFLMSFRLKLRGKK